MELSWLDKVACSMSPKWGQSRLVNKAKNQYLASGFVTPASNKKSMKGAVVRALSPDGDTIDKQPGSRALSRDLYMTSPLAVATLRRKVINVIGSELKLQSRVDREFLNLDDTVADKFESSYEREFDSWANSYAADFDGQLMFGELQAMLYFNMLLNGDVFFMLPWRSTPESPYEMSVKLIDSDLVRDPDNLSDIPAGSTVKGGVEKNSKGQVTAYWVANYYPNESYCTDRTNQTIKRVPVFARGRRQIWHFMACERIGQRRGMPIFAPVIDALKQISRISDAEMMNLLVSSFFSVFIKDSTGFGGLMQDGFTPAETVTGGGGDGPTEPQEDKNPEDVWDLEMGHGNVMVLDDKKDITIADPKKADEAFEKFFELMARQVAAAANMPIEQVHMHFQTSYTAAKGADNESWKSIRVDRSHMSKKFCSIVGGELLREGVVKGRLSAPGYFDDMVNALAWARASWIGPGQGQLNPLDESKAGVIRVNNKVSTHEEEYMARTGNRWDAAMVRYARENDIMEDLGIDDNPDPNEILGPDGQKDPSQTEDGGAAPAGNEGNNG